MTSTRYEKDSTFENLEKLVKYFSEKLEEARTGPSKRAEACYFEIMKSHYKRVLEAKQKNEILGWIGDFVPVEIFLALDLVPFFPYQFVIVLAVRGLAGLEYLDIGQGYGITSETCAWHRFAVGLCKSGAIPQPDFITFTPLYCEGYEKGTEIMAMLSQCPVFLVDCGYGYSEEAIGYFKRELQDLIHFLEEQTGKKMDYDRLGEIVKLSAQAVSYWKEIAKQRKNIPTPMGTMDVMMDNGILATSAGSEEAVRYFETHYQEIKERVDRREGVIPQERHRLAWWASYPYFDIDIVDWIANEYGAIVVADMFDSLIFGEEALDTSDPLRYMAMRVLSHSLTKVCGPYEGVADKLVQSCKERNIEAAIYLTHMGCKHLCSLSHMVRDAMKDQLGIPTLILDADTLDHRVVSSAQLRNRISEFFAMLEGR